MPKPKSKTASLTDEDYVKFNQALETVVTHLDLHDVAESKMETSLGVVTIIMPPRS